MKLSAEASSKMYQPYPQSSKSMIAKSTPSTRTLVVRRSAWMRPKLARSVWTPSLAARPSAPGGGAPSGGGARPRLGTGRRGSGCLAALLRGAARPRPRRRGRAAATAGDARSRGPSGAAAPRPGLSCLPQSLCAFCTGRSASAPHASNRAAPLVRPMGLAMDRSGAAGLLASFARTLLQARDAVDATPESGPGRRKARERR